jgi:hypothetical protein
LYRYSGADAARVFVSSAARILARDAAAGGGTDNFDKARRHNIFVQFCDVCSFVQFALH